MKKPGDKCLHTLTKGQRRALSVALGLGESPWVPGEM